MAGDFGSFGTRKAIITESRSCEEPKKALASRLARMNRDRLIYYVAFPLVVAALCAFSYYLGWNRGRQPPPSGGTDTEASAPEPHEIGGELTFFKTLKAKEEPQQETTPSIERLRKAEERAEVEPSSDGSSVVQVSAFRDIGKAHELVDDLKNRGFTAFTKPSPSGSGERWYRVYVGPFPGKEESSNAQQDLAEKGFGRGFLTTLDTGGETK
jgi:hypothetical protein